MVVGEGGPVVSDVAPEEDSGAETLDRYLYQAHLVAARCASLLLEGRIKAIICEWHEDYIVQFANGPSELVSVKHHDGDQPHWTIAKLCADGGLKHLFERYQLFDENVTCRLQTNEQLRSGDPAELKAACHGEDVGCRRSWAEKLVGHLGSEDVDLIDRFLGELWIDDGLPDRRMVDSVHRDTLMPAVGEKLGLALVEQGPCYQRLVHLAVEASRSSGAALVVEALSDSSALARSREHERTLEAKTIDRQRALTAIGRSAAVPKVLLSARVPVTTERTVLAKKLDAGGVGTTGINSARRLRANWERHVGAWSSGLPGDDDQIEHLRAEVVRLAGLAEGRTREPGREYATRMIEVLEELLNEHDASSMGAAPLTVELLLGLAYERTEACEIFWSDPFDPAIVP